MESYLVISSRKIATHRLIEILYLAYLFYTITAKPLGLYVPYLAGVWLYGLAFISLLTAKWTKPSRILVGLILATSFFYLFMEIFVHQLPLSTRYNYEFILWLVNAIIIFNIYDQPDFIKYLAIVMFVTGLVLQQFIVFTEDLNRAYLEVGSGIDNSNDFAAWLGFCGLIFWLWGWRQPKISRRLVLWAMAIIAVFIMMQTVSRASAIAVFVSGLVGLRGVFRKDWWKILIVLGFLAIILSSPLFSNLINEYEARLYQDTGRSEIWITAIENIIQNPFIGYGADRNAWYTSSTDNFIMQYNAHNGFLFLWVVAGILPVIPFALLWYFCFRQGFSKKWLRGMEIDALPLLIFVFLEMMQSNIYFVAPWSIAGIFYCFLNIPSYTARLAKSRNASPNLMIS